jgi:uncharacterized protein (DUF302 family)
MPTLSRITLALLALSASVHALAQQPVLITPAGAPNPFLQYTAPVAAPFALPQFGFPSLPSLPDLRGVPIPLIGTLTPAPSRPYTMRPGIPQETKKQMMQMMMPIMSNVMRMSMPDAMNWFAHKIKAKPGLSFDDVVESMMLRANKLNFKYVGNNLMYKDFRAVLGDMDAPRIEVHSFCDIAVGRDLLKISPEFLVFLPCRIGVMEDADKQIWVMMLDWNLDWVAGYEGQMGVSPELAKGAVDIRNKMADIMQAGANGDL